jgi:hypothetical protein
MRIAIFIGLLQMGLTVGAQDTLIYKTGENLLISVRNVNIPTTMSYKLYSNSKGPTYTVPLYDIFQIRYENGSIDEFNYEPPAPPKRDTVVILKVDTTHSADTIDIGIQDQHRKSLMLNYITLHGGVVLPQESFGSNKPGNDPASGFAQQGFLCGTELRILFLKYLGVMFKAEYSYFTADMTSLQSLHADSIVSNTNWRNFEFALGGNLNIPLFTQHLALEMDGAIGITKLYRPELEFMHSSQKQEDYVGICYEIGGALRLNISNGFGIKLFAHHYFNRVKEFDTFEYTGIKSMDVLNYKGGMALLFLF